VGACPRGIGLKGASIHFFSHLKSLFKQKFTIYQNVYKNACFFEKSLLKSPQRWGLFPQTLYAWALHPDPRVVTLANCYGTLSSAFLIVLNAFYYDRGKNKCNISRCSTFAFAPIFYFRLCSFVDADAKIVFVPGRRVP